MDIAQCMWSISPTWHGLAGASDASLNEIESATQLVLPSDFKTFMKWSDGGEGKFPHIYLSIWPSANIVALNQDYQIRRYLGDRFVAIGSDGGPICFLLDYRSDQSPSFASVNFGDLDLSEIKVIAPSFTAAIEMALTGKLVDDDL